VASTFSNIAKIPELRRRILFTLGMLAVYRVGIFITAPGVDRAVMAKMFAQASNTIFSVFNMFSGGGLEQLSIFALGIMPYISSSIILQLLTVVIPALDKLSKEGEMGRKKITQYTRYLTVVISMLQGFGIAVYLEGLRSNTGEMVVNNPGFGFRLLTMITLTAGTAFIMWLGEQITEHGIGNGISLIIFAGIVARLPGAIIQTYSFFEKDMIKPITMLLLVVIMVGAVAAIVFFERAQRRIPVQYAKRVVGRKVMGGQSTHLPLKINTAGVIPPIFASSILVFPATLANMFPSLKGLSDILNPASWSYSTAYVLLIVFFCFFYTAVAFNPVDVADNMKKFGGYIPGIRPGKKTAEFIDHVLSRITVGGAIYIAIVCVLPTVLMSRFGVPFYFGGTALLIAVGVALDTVAQIESHLITRHYDGLAGPGGPRIRGRRR
jgi:preprotein translocase subunit SecY